MQINKEYDRMELLKYDSWKRKCVHEVRIHIQNIKYELESVMKLSEGYICKRCVYVVRCAREWPFAYECTQSIPGCVCDSCAVPTLICKQACAYMYMCACVYMHTHI
jgi:hypothetical protein